MNTNALRHELENPASGWTSDVIVGETAKEKYNAQVKVAVDGIFVSATDEGRIGPQDLYCAILLVYK